MTLTGIGVDILELDRIRTVSRLSRIAEFFMTQSELAQFSLTYDREQFLLSRFALKEAVIKAFPHKLSPLDFSVERGDRGVTVELLPKDAERFHVHASLSHSKEYVVGYAHVYTL